MGRMLESKLCVTFHMIPTGKDLDEFRCDNPEYNQRLIDKNLAVIFPSVLIGLGIYILIDAFSFNRLFYSGQVYSISNL
jgi:hypothetical protein